MSRSMIRYTGGKARLAPLIARTIALNDLKRHDYCDPEVATEKAIYTSGSRDGIRKKSDWQRLACATLYLNRTNVSGIIPGGPIGGRAQRSQYKLDSRFNRAKLVKKIDALSRFKDRVTGYNFDACELVSDVLLHISPDELFTFFDPPYYGAMGKNLYASAFTCADHERLAASVASMREYKWVLTLDVCEQALKLYGAYSPCVYQLGYSVNRVRTAKEYLFSSASTVLEETAGTCVASHAGA